MTWVKDKVETRYFYYYLKKRVSSKSIYVGPFPNNEKSDRALQEAAAPKINGPLLESSRRSPSQLIDRYRTLMKTRA
ncbi:MAG: hypothetical protein QXJ52_06515 [Candidatus Korarchaeota archaeon]